MSFNPLEEKGVPLEQQLKSWETANVEPYDKNSVHPYTRTRVILMNGIEVEGAIFKHQFARHCRDLEMRRKIAMTRRIEQQQQKMVNWLIPGDQTNLEVTLGFEQVAVDLTAWLARHEPDPNVKAALDYALLEDFDHLYRYANLYEMTEGKTAEDIIGEDLTEVFPGRPTVNEHQDAADTIRKHINGDKAEFLTLMHLLTIIAAEQQTMNLYMNVGNRPVDRLGRGLFLEIAQIEEQHVSHYESLVDPSAGWLERAVLHEYNECFLYYSCLQSEVDKRIRKMWQWHLDCEIDHLQRACELLKEHGRKDPQELLPAALPEPLVTFESNREYVRQIEAEQVDWTTDGTEIVKGQKQPDSYKEHQRQVNAGPVPSQKVIEDHVADLGEDYRLESKGEHPVERFRARKEATR